MKFLRAAIVAVFLLAVPGVSVAAESADDFRLTVPLLKKLEAIDAESRKLGLDSDAVDDDDEADEGDIDSIVRSIERDPRRRALLARHGTTAREAALCAMAQLHAGAYLAFERGMDKQAAAKLLSGYTDAQRANIELLRKHLAAKR